MTVTDRFDLYRQDRVLLRKELVLSGVTATDRKKIEKYLVGTNWEWRSQLLLDES